MLGHAVRSAFVSASRAQNAMRSALLRIALPNRCALCGNLSQHRVCGACDTTSIENKPLRCPCCAATFEPAAGVGQRCGTCLATAPAFDETWVLADYAEPLDTLAQALKFSAQPGLARWFADKLAQCAQAAGLTPDLVLPVPLSAQRLAFRGYNQAWEIAKPLARRLNAATAGNLVYRLRDTAPQTDMADARQRLHNVRGAFAIRADSSKAKCLSGLHVMVVDDIMTSGATLAEVANMLKRAGVARVTNLVALRTPSPQAGHAPAHPHAQPNPPKH